MSLALSDLATWLTTQLDDDTVSVEVNWQQDSPDRSVTFAILPGGVGYLFDGAFEQDHIQVRCRDETDDAAEVLCQAVHTIMKSAESSFQLGASWVLTIEPMSQPAFFSRDVKQRTSYMSAYQFTVSTGE